MTSSPHTAPLTKREEIAEGTMALHFAKPAHFQFRAGQSMDLSLLNPLEADAEGNTPTFSIASAPFDHDLMIATRMRDTAFKRVLRSAAPGIQVKIDGPSGSFTLHRKPEKPAVFLAGGIGITPFLSIIRQTEHDAAPHHIYLFYSNRRPEDAAQVAVTRVSSCDEPKLAVGVAGRVKRGTRSTIAQLLVRMLGLGTDLQSSYSIVASDRRQALGITR